MEYRRKQDPIFKGSTRPSMIFGVPLTPLIAIMMPLSLLAMWSLYFAPYVALLILMMAIPVFLLMRIITKKDDQRLMQYLLRLKMRAQQRNVRLWKVGSYSPIPYKKGWHCD